MYKIFLALTLVAISIIRNGIDADCSVGGPSQTMNWDSGAYVNVFNGLPFSCSGVVTKWEFYARQAGTFMAGVWRPEANEGFRYMGSNTITVDSAGVHTVEISAAEQIPVEEGDVIGIHYPSSTHVSNGGIVPYEDSKFARTPGITDAMLQPIYNSNTRDEALTAGVTVLSGLSAVRRIPALTGFVGPDALATCQAENAQLREELEEAQAGPDPVMPTAAPEAVVSDTAHKYTLEVNGIEYLVETSPQHAALQADNFCQQYGMKLAQIENEQTFNALANWFQTLQADGVNVNEVATGERSAVNLDRDVPYEAFNAAGWSCVTIVSDGSSFKLVSKKCQGERAILCAAVPLYC